MSGRLQHLQPQECETRGLQKLDQSVYLYKQLLSHREGEEGVDEATGVLVGLSEEAEGKRRSYK